MEAPNAPARLRAHRRQQGLARGLWPGLVLAAVSTVWRGLANLQPFQYLPTPGPLSVRHRPLRLRDPKTGLPRQPPPAVDEILDYFQRTFPDVVTEEHTLVKRWEDIVDIFGSVAAANELCYKEPSILRWPKNRVRRSWAFMCLYMNPQAAREVVFECPYLLTKRGKDMRKTLPALLNVYKTKQRLGQIAVTVPGLMHIPVGNFYTHFQDLIAITGDPEAGEEVAREAMEEISKGSFKMPYTNHYKTLVPDCYPALIAIMGGIEQARAAIDREPTLLIHLGRQFMGKLLTLRQLVGYKGAQVVLRKAPYLLLREHQKKSRKFRLAFGALEHVFGNTEARRVVLERPELLSLGVCLERALGFAERKLGSVEAVRDNFDSILRRTGLQQHMDNWETKARPRFGYWTPSSGKHHGMGSISCSWSPLKNALGWSGPARGRWDEEDPGESRPGEGKATAHPIVDAELLLPSGSRGA